MNCYKANNDTHKNSKNSRDIQRLGGILYCFFSKHFAYDLTCKSLLNFPITVQISGVISIQAWLTSYVGRKHLFHN